MQEVFSDRERIDQMSRSIHAGVRMKTSGEFRATSGPPFSFMWAFLILLLLLSPVRADVLSAPWPPRICAFPQYVTVEQDLPLTFGKGRFQITISEPTDPGIREEGGSGGPMLAFTIRDSKDGSKTTFYDQCVNGALLKSFNGRPQLEIWGRGGGGYFARELIRYVHGKYRSVRIDRFVADKNRAEHPSVTTTLPGDVETLYLIETVRPEESELQGQ